MHYPKFVLNIGPWQFKPRLKLSIVMLLIFSSLVYLGFWQLHRATEKKDLIAKMHSKINSAPVSIKTLTDPSLANSRFQPVTAQGLFMNQYTLLLDNQMEEHEAGFRIFVPLHVPYLDKWVLVDRGWVPSKNARLALPEITPIFGLQKIDGYINTISTGTTLVKDQLQAEPTWPLLIQELDYQLISEQIQHPIYNFILQTEVPDSSYINASKNIGYALQWFSFAFMVLIYYLFISFKRNIDK